MRKGKSLKNLIIGFMSIILVYNIVSQQITMKRLRSEFNETSKEHQHLLMENERLKAEVEASKNNPLYMERLARERLGLVLPGETIIIDDPTISAEN